MTHDSLSAVNEALQFVGDRINEKSTSGHLVYYYH